MRNKEKRLRTRDIMEREETRSMKMRDRESERKGEKRENHEGLFLVGLQEPASVWLELRKV